MNRRIITLIAASLLAGSAAASDKAATDKFATLGGIEGTVMVGQADKFVTAEPGQNLAAGDRVLVMEGGKAIVTFADGCALPVESGSHLVVPEKSTCAGGIAATQRVNPQVAQAVGDTFMVGNKVFLITAIVSGAIIAREVTEGDDNVSSP